MRILYFQINDRRIRSNVEGFQETKTPAMEEFTDSEETSHPVVHRAFAAGYNGMYNGFVQIVGGSSRTQRSHQVHTVSHHSAAVNCGL